VRSRLQYAGLNAWQTGGLIIFILFGLLHSSIAKDGTNGKAGGLIPYAANTIDRANRNVSPLGSQEVSGLYYRHWLGTDPLGRDVLAGLLSGANVALKVGFFAIGLSLLIGIILGIVSGYYGDKNVRLEKKKFYILVPLLFLTIFYLIYGTLIVKALALLSIFFIIYFISKNSDSSLHSGISLPLDLGIMKLIEIVNSVPGIFIILVVLTLFHKQSLYNVIFVIAFIKWPSITRFIRAEVLKIKEQDFIQSAKGIGLPDWKILKDTVLPLAISPVIVATAFTFANAILLESTLSFLGIGIPPDIVTWGSLLNEARSSFSSWWLALFPGLMIYLTILLFNSVGDGINEYLRG